MGELNNLLSFNDFNGELPLNRQKRTKRTEVGLDVLNENFYDRLLYKVKNDRPFESLIPNFEELVIKSIKTGGVEEFEEKGDYYYFKMRGREFKINDNGEVQIKTPINQEWIVFEVPETTATNIIEALEDEDYLD
jgi:hypothetical protein